MEEGTTWVTCSVLPGYRPPHPWMQEYPDSEDDGDTSKSLGEYLALRSLDTIVRTEAGLEVVIRILLMLLMML